MRRWKVLVVEDEPLVAFDIESRLQDLGCDTVGPLAHLSEALTALETEVFDCAILDVNVLGGHITPVAELLLDRHVPLLLATGYPDFALSDRLAGEARLAKPYTSKQFEREVRLLCARIVI